MSLQAYNSAVIRDITVTPTKGNFMVNSLHIFIILDFFVSGFSLDILHLHYKANCQKIPERART